MIARFGGYEVDSDRVEIRHHGVQLAVQPQVFAVIEFLIAERDRVVSKEELLDQVWGDRFVSESALTSRIKSARRVLGDSGSEQKVIRTAQGRGYRFVAPLNDDAATSAVAEHDGAGDDALPPPMNSSNEVVDERSDEWPLVGRHRELAHVERMIADVSCPGIVITGPEQIGAARFAQACLERARSAGAKTDHVVGVATAASIPFAVLSHVLSADVLITEQPNDDLARAEVHRRALESLEARAGGARLVLVIENAHVLDEMTAALISTATLRGLVFVLAVRSRLRGAADQASEELLPELRLRRLDETDIDILLHRVLGGPIEPSTLRQLVSMSDGRPGLLRDIVETSLGVGALVSEHGVWRLTAPAESTAQRMWNPTELSPAAAHCAEVLALLPGLPEDIVITLTGDEPLDELDRHRLVAIDEESGGVLISLADPLLARAVIETIGPLRERRLKRELADRMVDANSPPRTLAIVARWKLDQGQPIDDSLMLTAAQTAMILGDMATAGDLVDCIADRENPAVQLIDAEVALRRSQWSRAESLFEAIDADRLDEISSAHVLRRRAAIQFYAKARYDETIDWLAAEADRQGGRPARALRARRAGMLAYLGRVDDTLEAVAELGQLRGLTAIEVLLSTGSAHLHRGGFQRTLDLMEEVDRLIDDVPEAWADEPRDAVLTLRCSGLLHIGAVEEASSVARGGLPIGRRTALGYFPTLAASIELHAGRPRAAREFVRQAIESSHRAEFPQYLSVAEAIAGRIELALGNHESAERRLVTARAARAEVAGELDWLLSIMIVQIETGLGRPGGHGELLELASEAGSVGASMREADLLTEAALRDPTDATAKSVLGRIDELVAEIDGDLWPLKAMHVRALATGAPLDPVWNQYRAAGYHGLVEG